MGLEGSDSVKARNRRRISRRDFLAGSGGAVAGSCLASVSLADRQSAAKSRPNIIFFHTDSWDGRAMGFLGHPALKSATPNCDRLAARGTAFRNTYCSHPICCPSRANMWTGKYTHRIESWNNHKGLNPGAETLFDKLRQAGYTLASGQGGYGKHDYLSGGHSQLARVTAWTGPADIQLPVFRVEAPRALETYEKRVHRGDWEQIDKAKAFLGEHAGDDSPFFLYVGTEMPHPPFTTSRHYMEMIPGDAVTVPPADKQDHPVMKYQRINKNWRHGFDNDTVIKTRAIYYAMCAETDAMLGELLDETDRLGLAENTVFIFSSDHGENNLEHRQWYKMNMYESSVRVPLIVAGPGVRRGKIVDNVVSLIDLYPTLADIAGLAKDGDLDGESLIPLLAGRAAAGRGHALAMFTGCSSNTSMFMLRKGQWKYVAYPGYGPQLFNLVDDPDEIDNLAGTKPDVVRQLDEELRRAVDYEDVHRRLLAYDKASFRRWRERVKADPIHLREYGADIKNASYEQIMANCYIGWTDEHAAKLEKWLEKGTEEISDFRFPISDFRV